MTSTVKSDMNEKPGIEEEIDADDAWTFKITRRDAGQLLALEADCTPDFGIEFIKTHVKEKRRTWKRWVKKDAKTGVDGHWEKVV